MQLERLRRDRDTGLKQLINEVLRRGLRDISARSKKREPFRTEPIDGVTPLLDNVDNVAEVLAYAEGEAFK
ncbi:MAG TPA: hypothetical protein VH684_14790 [Xanthobacteraceae bacterium]